MQTTIRGRLTCFCRVCYVMWYGQEECDEWYVMYEIDYVRVTELSATGRSHVVASFLYEMQTPCNCFTLSLSGSDSRRSNSWWDDNDAMMKIKVSRRWRWWSWVHDGALEMEIKGTRWWWPYHITYIDCMWCLSFMHLILLWLTVAF